MTARTARNACILGGVLYLCVGRVPVYMGLVVPSVLPCLDKREQIVPSLAEKFLPTFFLMMLAGAAISASLSTVVSVLLSRGSIMRLNHYV